MKRNRILSFILIAVMLVSACLSGCGRVESVLSYLATEPGDRVEADSANAEVKLKKRGDTASEAETGVEEESMADEADAEETAAETKAEDESEEATRVTLYHSKSRKTREAEQSTAAEQETVEETAAEVPETEETADDGDGSDAEDEGNAEFRQFLNDFLIGEFEGDTLSTNFFFTDPEAFGIDMSEVGWASFTDDPDEEETDEDYINGLLEGLEAFDYEALNREDRIAYDCFKDYLEDALLSDGLDYYYEPLCGTSGYQATITVELSMFAFREEQDVENYLTLLELFPEHFADLLAYEEEKSEAGLFMADTVLDDVLEQMSSFTESREGSFLYGTFESRLSELDLSEDVKAEYIERNNALVPGVYDAYDALAEGLEALRGTGQYGESLYNYPDGAAYYDYLLKSDIGTDMDGDELWDYLEERGNELLNEYILIYYRNPDIFDEVEDIEYPTGTPEEIMASLIEMTKDEFPELENVEYQIHLVDESLREYLNPAFYYVPPVDNDRINNIYINPDEDGSLPEDIFTVLAHEGYPGHMYQMNYLKSQSDIPLRQIIANIAYEEGWAEYMELQSYARIDGISEDMADFLRIDSEYTLILSALMDIGIHYKGWDREDFAEYVTQYFEIDEEGLADLYLYISENPAEYLKYAVGCSVMEDIIDRAYDEADGDLDMKEFYKEYLEIGPAPQNIVVKYLFEEE